MCGIAGILDVSTPPSAALVRSMVGRLRHRGPDASGVATSGPVCFGHARLSIVDIEGGAQPMAAPSDKLLLTFNGEIFNHVELREELKAHWTFRTRSDTEVILAAYTRWGRACVERFNGQWAFALYDARDRSLLLSRDRVGIRPLFFSRRDGGVTFASEVKALFADPSIERALDPVTLYDTIHYWAPASPSASAFAGIEQVPPGHSLVFDAGGAVIRERYWAPRFAPDESIGPAAAADEVAALLDDATRIRLRADVPVGAYLSGGLDSSITTALAQRYAGEKLAIYSLAFDDTAYDEAAYQTEVSAKLGLTYRSIRVGHADIAKAFAEVVHHAEAPLFRTAPAPLYLLSGLVREHGTKAVLTGEGADEVFAGYDIFREAKLRRLWALEPERARYTALVRRLYPYLSDVQRQSPEYLRRFFHAEADSLKDPFFSHLPRWAVSSFAHRFLSEDVLEAARPDESRDRLRAGLGIDFDALSPLARGQAIELTHLLPGYLLCSQGDRMSMGHSVEGRYPFLDHRVIERAGELPDRIKLLALNEKRVLKSAFGELIPASVRRRKKQPYRAPESESFLENGALVPWAQELLSKDALKRYGVFRPDPVAKLLQKAQGRGLTSFRENLAFVCILSTQLLARGLVDQGGVGPTAVA